MNVMLSIFRTIFFFPPASKLFTFSRSALLSSPSTIRPSSATTDTPSTSRFVIFNATLFSSSLESSSGGNPGRAPQSISIIVRAGHVISAVRTHQFTSPRFQPLRADGTIRRSIFDPCGQAPVGILPPSLSRRCLCRFHTYRNNSLLRGMFHGPIVIAHPSAREKCGKARPDRASLVSGLFGWLVHGEHPIACRCLRNIPGGTTSPAQFQPPL